MKTLKLALFVLVIADGCQFVKKHVPCFYRVLETEVNRMSGKIEMMWEEQLITGKFSTALSSCP